MTDQDLKHRSGLLVEAVARLQEWFDTVQIIATVVSTDGERDTYGLPCGYGNMYARVESCREFVEKSDERARASVRPSNEP